VAGYSLFSLAPLLHIVISFVGPVLGQEAVRGQMFLELQGPLGSEASRAVEGLPVSSVFGELQDAPDRTWRAPVRDRTGGLWAWCGPACCPSTRSWASHSC
jgi:membrane protein